MPLSWTDAKNYVVTGCLGLWFIFISKDAIESPSTDQVEKILKQNAVASVTKDEMLEFVNRYARFNEDKHQINGKLQETHYLITNLEKRQSEILVNMQEGRTGLWQQVDKIREDMRENDKELQQIRENVTRITLLLDGIQNRK